LRRERPGQSLQATALVNEAYIRLKKDKQATLAGTARISLRSPPTRCVKILVMAARAPATPRSAAAPNPDHPGRAVAAGGETLDFDLLGPGRGPLDPIGHDATPIRLALSNCAFSQEVSIEESAEALGCFHLGYGEARLEIWPRHGSNAKCKRMTAVET